MSPHKRFGAVYTEPAEVRFMVRLSLATLLSRRIPGLSQPAALEWLFDDSPPAAEHHEEIERALASLTVADPACGNGVFLAATRETLCALWRGLGLPGGPSAEHLHGVDRDEAALAEARTALPSGVELQQGDSLAGDDGDFVWERDFPKPFEVGGFDLVIGNPPYVRHELIGPPGAGDEPSLKARRRYRASLRERLSRRLPELADERIPGRSDYYLYFFLYGLSLLRPGGLLAFITSNAWLDGNYGRLLRRFLWQRSDPLWLVVQRSHRAFGEAGINAVMAFLGAPGEASEPLRLVEVGHLDGLGREELQLALSTDGSRSLGQEIVKVVDRSGPAPAKWGAIARLSLSLQPLLEPSSCLVPLAGLFEVETYLNTGGANGFFFLPRSRVEQLAEGFRLETGTGELFVLPSGCLAPLFKSSQECPRIRLKTEDCAYWLLQIEEPLPADHPARSYVEWGESQGYHQRSGRKGKKHWYILPPQAYSAGRLLVGRTHHQRHVVFWNSEGVVSNELYRLHRRSGGYRSEALAVAALNSSLTGLFSELMGRTNLGQGALKTEGSDWRQVRLPAPEVVGPVASELEQLVLESDWVEQPRESVFGENPLQERVDRLILGALEIPGVDPGGVREALRGLVEGRLQKARSRR